MNNWIIPKHFELTFPTPIIEMSNFDPLLIKAVTTFRQQFESDPEVAAFGPGRANLIGEHVDYNDGYVLPFALPYRTIIVGTRTASSTTTVMTDGDLLPPSCSFKIDGSLCKGDPEWANYIKGTIYQYLGDLPKDFAFDAVVVSNVPMGGGLSSSAALEVATATFIAALCGGMPHVDGVQKALRCQKAEHDFADTPCGIMDQYISALGEDKALLKIDCRSNEFELVPFGGGDAETPIILVTNSKVKHRLSGSEYPTRVKQCKEAVAALQKKFPQVKALRDATMGMLDSVKEDISTVVYQRAHHVISEDKRTMATVAALRASDYKTAGVNMTESHRSLKEDYEVSCAELDVLVEIALRVPGVYGSRMTGGGFGGCTVTLVKPSAVAALKQALLNEYPKQTGLLCECYDAVPSAGAGVIDLAPIYAMMDAEDEKPLSTWVDWIVPIAFAGLAVALGASFLLQRARK